MAAEHVLRMGRRIRARRQEVGLTQRELAEKLPGKSDGNQISKWERGEHRPSDDTLDHIAEVLGVDAAYFMAPEPRASDTPDLLARLARPDETQLDRIERRLDDLYELLKPTDDAEALEAELDAADQQAAAPAEGTAPSVRGQRRPRRAR